MPRLRIGYDVKYPTPNWCEADVVGMVDHCCGAPGHCLDKQAPGTAAAIDETYEYPGPHGEDQPRIDHAERGEDFDPQEMYDGDEYYDHEGY